MTPLIYSIAHSIFSPSRRISYSGLLKRFGYMMLFILTISIWGCEPIIETPFERFTIPKDKHYSTYRVELLESSSLIFNATFDESVVYECQTIENQWDTNKLFGFSDCNSAHHENSARFGWRWINKRIEIIAYCYVNGERIIEYIGSTQPFKTNSYEIQLTDTHYIFRFDNETMEIPRAKPCDTGAYYLLFPYFGGNETAPHDIHIMINRIY
jgi:hypothetical protein